MSSRRGLALAAASLWAAAACADDDWVQAGELLRQRLDERTTVVLTGLKAPLVFYRGEPQLGVNAREYVHFGPLELNRQGELRYYLWLGVWSTIGQGPDAGVQRCFERVYLFADGEPMELVATSWKLADYGLEDSFYERPVSGAVDAWYAVTADQVRWIGAAKEIHLVCGLDAARRYEAWEWDPRAVKAFADYSVDRELR